MSTVLNDAYDINISPSKFRLAAIVSCISIFGYFVLSVFLGVDEIANGFARIGFLGIAASLILSFGNYFLRFYRWKWLLCKTSAVNQLENGFSIYLSGFAFTILPGKLGEVIRSIYLKHQSIPFHVSIGVFVAERLYDLLAMLILFAIGLSAFPSLRIGAISVFVFVFTLVAIVIAAPKLQKPFLQLSKTLPAKLGRLLIHSYSTLLEAKKCFSLPMMLCALPISIISWALEGIAIYCLAYFAGVHIDLAACLSIHAGAGVVGGLSFVPGGVGGTELVMITMLAMVGISSTLAVAITLVARATQLWFAVLLGFVAIFFLGRSSENEKIG